MTTHSPHQPSEEPLAQRILQRIQKEHIVPTSRFAFIFKNYFFWGLGAMSIVLGALAFAAIIFDVQYTDWQYALVTHSDTFSFLLDVAPFLWIAILALFIGIGYINVRRTKHGYRYPLSVIALGAVLTSIALGSALFETGIGGAIEAAAEANVPFHHSIMSKQHAWWLAPEKGLLGGTIIASTPTLSAFDLRDFKGTVWHIDASDLRTPDLAAVARGGMVRVVGVPTTASSTLHACFVFPWEKASDAWGGPPPVPSSVFASTSARALSVPRSDSCTGLRPYEELKTLDDHEEL